MTETRIEYRLDSETHYEIEQRREEQQQEAIERALSDYKRGVPIHVIMNNLKEEL